MLTDLKVGVGFALALSASLAIISLTAMGLIFIAKAIFG